MKFKQAFRTVAVAAAVATASVSAFADYVVLDGWQVNVPNFTPTLTTDIGHLFLSGGLATVNQQVDNSNQVFVGAKFSESGNIFSVGYIKENSAGNGDSGSSSIFGVGPNGLNQLQLVFSGVTGVVSALNSGGGFHYDFTGGIFSLLATSGNGSYTQYASGSIVGLGGNTGSTNIIGGTAGDSNVLATVLNEIGAFDLFDSTGTSLKPQLSAGEVLFQVTTTNTLNPASIVGGGCTFDGGETFVPCLTLKVTSEGAANLVQKVPEPASIALLGLGLLGLGVVRRRKSAK